MGDRGRRTAGRQPYSVYSRLDTWAVRHATRPRGAGERGMESRPESGRISRRVPGAASVHHTELVPVETRKWQGRADVELRRGSCARDAEGHRRAGMVAPTRDGAHWCARGWPRDAVACVGCPLELRRHDAQSDRRYRDSDRETDREVESEPEPIGARQAWGHSRSRVERGLWVAANGSVGTKAH